MHNINHNLQHLESKLIMLNQALTVELKDPEFSLNEHTGSKNVIENKKRERVRQKETISPIAVWIQCSVKEKVKGLFLLGYVFDVLCGLALSRQLCMLGSQP